MPHTFRSGLSNKVHATEHRCRDKRFLPLSMGKDLPLSCRFSYLLKKAGIMSTKRIFTIVMPGKIMA
jgi:hypothetical protein